MELDFSKIQSKEDFMEWFSRNFNFPSYFGKNWDAVWDCLCELIESKSITIKNRNDLYSESDYSIFKKMIDDFNKDGKVKITLIEENV